MHRWEIINSFIRARNYTSYMEIGVRNARENFARIKCNRKVGIDPALLNSSPQFRICTSDDYFHNNHERFDLIFIDGFHEEQQVARDIANSLTRLNPNGLVVVHDALPPTAWHQRPQSEYQGGFWNGTVWKAVLRAFATCDHYCYVIDSDFGCAIIDTAKPRQHAIEALNSSLDYERDYKLLRRYVVSKKAFLNEGYCRLPALYHNTSNTYSETSVPSLSAPSERCVIYGSPYSLTKKLGLAYNEFIRLLKDDMDFACLTDADAMFTIPNYGHLIEGVIKAYPDCRLFYAKTQRIGCYWQRDETIPGDNMTLHRAHGMALAEKYGVTCTPAGEDPPGSGFLILLRKDLWKQVPFKEEGILGVDWDFYRRVQARKEPILLMRGVYLYHWYRGGNKNDVEHLH